MPRVISEKLVYLLLLIIPLVVTRQWLLPGLPQTHDAETHISRAAVFAKSISQGNIWPRWGGELNWRYGTPSIMFLYPGIPYFSALVHLATSWQFITIFKLLIILGFSGSGIVWFRWMRNLGFSLWPAFISSLFYLLAPYRLVNIFVRGALGEHLGFLLFPLVMLAATKLWTGRSWRYMPPLALAVAGLILVHNLSALMYLPLLGLMPIFLHNDRRSLFNRSKLLAYIAGIGLGLALSAFFWLPAIMESKYTLSSWIFSAKDWYADSFLSARQLIWSPWGYGWSQPGDQDGMTFQIGIAQIIASLASLGVILVLTFRKGLANWRQPSYRIACLGLLCGLIGIYFALPISAVIWKAIPVMGKFQFPWRFLAYTIIGSSLSIAVVAEIVKSNQWLRAIMIAAPILFTVNYWKIAGPSELTEKFLAEDYVGTTDTGETSPIWAIRFQEKMPKAPVEVASAAGEVKIHMQKKLYQRHEFIVTTTETAQIVDNTLYFPGWKVYANGVSVPIEYQDENWRGLITFNIPRGEHRIVVVFEETKVRKLADFTSLIALVALVFVIEKSRVNKTGR